VKIARETFFSRQSGLTGCAGKTLRVIASGLAEPDCSRNNRARAKLREMKAQASDKPCPVIATINDGPSGFLASIEIARALARGWKRPTGRKIGRDRREIGCAMAR